MDVIKNVFRFVIFILWLRAQLNSFKWFLAFRARYTDLWKECLYRLATLCRVRIRWIVMPGY